MHLSSPFPSPPNFPFCFLTSRPVEIRLHINLPSLCTMIFQGFAVIRHQSGLRSPDYRTQESWLPSPTSPTTCSKSLSDCRVIQHSRMVTIVILESYAQDWFNLWSTIRCCYAVTSKLFVCLVQALSKLPSLPLHPRLEPWVLQVRIVVVIIIIIIRKFMCICCIIIGHKCITESSVLSANAESQTKNCL